MIKTTQEKTSQPAVNLADPIELSDEETDLIAGGPEVENNPNSS